MVKSKIPVNKNQEHKCINQELISDIKTKQSNDDIRSWFFKEEIKELKSLLKDNIILMRNTYVSKEVFAEHEKVTKKLEDSIWLLQKWMENVNVRIASYSWIWAIVWSVWTSLAIGFIKWF